MEMATASGAWSHPCIQLYQPIEPTPGEAPAFIVVQKSFLPENFRYIRVLAVFQFESEEQRSTSLKLAREYVRHFNEQSD